MSNPFLDSFVVSKEEFQKIRRIGEGAFGYVDLVKKVKPKSGENPLYAMKVFKDAQNNEKIFLREVEVLARLSHPVTLNLLGFSKQNPKFIITQFMPQGNVSSFIQEHDINDTQILIILYGIAEGLRYLHSQKVMHCDVKPDNILLDDYLHPYISDFGLSKLSTNTVSTCGGTYPFMAPELFAWHPPAFPVDVYAYGMTVFSIVQYPPFQGVDPNTIASRVLNGGRPEFDESIIISPSLKKLIEDCWSQNPSDRPNFEEICNRFLKREILLNTPIDDRKYQEYVNLIHPTYHPKRPKTEDISARSIKPITVIPIPKKRDRDESRFKKSEKHIIDKGFTKLHYASINNDIQKASYLISKRADVNAKDINH